MRFPSLILVLAALVLAACEDKAADKITGYTEGDYVYVAAPDGGWVTEVLVKRGAQVRVGDPLFTLDADAQLAQRNQAAAQAKQAQSQLADLQKARRPDEITALQAALKQAQANLDFAQNEFVRTNDLHARGFATAQLLESKVSARDGAGAQVKQAAANLDLARKGARSDEIAAAAANVAATQAALARAELSGDGHAIGDAHHAISDAGGFDARPRAQSMLMGLGYRSATSRSAFLSQKARARNFP